MSLPQYLIDRGYEEAPANVNDRDASRRTSVINGYRVYFLDSEETARDAEEKEWDKLFGNIRLYCHGQIKSDTLLNCVHVLYHLSLSLFQT